MQVSVVIPAYNSEAWLERAFNSVLEQQVIDYEVIIVDNNSQDTTSALMKRLREKHPEILRLASEPRQGSAAARNHGVRIARGTWIQFLDDDDVLLPGKLTRQLALVHDDTDWVIGAFIQRDLVGNETVSTVLLRDAWKGLVYNGNTGHTNSNLIRREKYLEVGGQDESLPNGVDIDLYFRLLQRDSKIIYDDIPGSVYIDREGDRLTTLMGKTSRTRAVTLKRRVIDYLQAEKPAYFQENKEFFYAALLSAIRILATENMEEAEEAIKQSFPGGIDIAQLDMAFLPRFVTLYPVLGFSAVEKLRLFATKLLPPGLKRKLKGV